MLIEVEIIVPLVSKKIRKKRRNIGFTLSILNLLHGMSCKHPEKFFNFAECQ
jgi:hypothetical protein